MSISWTAIIAMLTRLQRNDKQLDRCHPYATLKFWFVYYLEIITWFQSDDSEASYTLIQKSTMPRNYSNPLSNNRNEAVLPMGKDKGKKGSEVCFRIFFYLCLVSYLMWQSFRPPSSGKARDLWATQLGSASHAVWPDWAIFFKVLSTKFAYKSSPKRMVTFWAVL